MGLPSKRRSSSQRKRRASHFALKKVQLMKNESGEMVPQRYARSRSKLKKKTG